MKKVFMIALLVPLMGIGAWAQSSQKVSEMIATEKVTYGQFAYFAATAMELAEDSATYEDAFALLQEKGMIHGTASAASAIPLKDIAFIAAKAWNLNGSLFYSIVPGPRYAFRLLKARGVISPLADPAKLSSGHEALNIITACIELDGGAK